MKFNYGSKLKRWCHQSKPGDFIRHENILLRLLGWKREDSFHVNIQFVLRTDQ